MRMWGSLHRSNTDLGMSTLSLLTSTAWFHKISTPKKVTGNPKGNGVSEDKVFQRKFEATNWNFQRCGGWGEAKQKKPFVGGVCLDGFWNNNTIYI